MLTAILFGAIFLIDGVSNYVSKKNSIITSSSCKYGILLVLNSAFAMFNFAVISGFDIKFSRINILYGVIYSVCCCLSIVVNMVTLKYITVAFKMVFVGAMSLAVSQLIGIIVFNEPVLLENIAKCVIRILAAVIAASPPKHGKKTMAGGIVWCFICVAVGAASTIVSKSGATEEAIDPNSWFFLTNFFLFFISLIFTAVTVGLYKFRLTGELKDFGKKGIFFVFLSSVTSNLHSLLSVKLMGLVDLSYYSPVSSALSMIACFAVSRLILREPAGKRMYIAVILSIIAVII